MGVLGKAHICATLIQVALSLSDAVPRSSDPGVIIGFTRNTAGMVPKAPQRQLVPQTSPEVHPCWNISLLGCTQS